MSVPSFQNRVLLTKLLIMFIFLYFMVILAIWASVGPFVGLFGPLLCPTWNWISKCAILGVQW